VESQIRAALAKIGELKERYQQVAVDDKGKRFTRIYWKRSNWAGCWIWQR